MVYWTSYDVETIDKENNKFIKYEPYMTLNEAEEYIQRMLDTKGLDYNEKLVLIKREYDRDRDLIEEEFIKEVDYENNNTNPNNN